MATEGLRTRRDSRPLWACAAALVACLLEAPCEPPCTVNTRPMLRERPLVEPADGADAAADGDSLTGAVGCGLCCAGAGHALWHSPLVMKLLLLPWQPPYQKWAHLDVMTSKWYRGTQLVQEPAARGREQIERSTGKTKTFGLNSDLSSENV